MSHPGQRHEPMFSDLDALPPDNGPRRPPAFVPTLTEVLPTLEPLGWLPEANHTVAAAEADGAQTPDQPPALQAGDSWQPGAGAAVPEPRPSTEVLQQLAPVLLARVQAELAPQLAELLPRLLQAQAERLGHQLRDEIDGLVRQSLAEALASTLAEAGHPAPAEPRLV